MTRKINYKITVLSLCAVIAASACGSVTEIAETVDGGKTELFFKIQEDEFRIVPTRGVAEMEGKISNVRIIAYKEDGTLDADGVFTDCSDLHLNLSSESRLNIYALVNYGDLTVPSDEASLKSLTIRVPDYSSISTNGIVMSGMVGNVDPKSDGVIKIEVDRLIAKVVIAIDQSGITPEGYTDNLLSDIRFRIKQCSDIVKPFDKTESLASSGAELTDGYCPEISLTSSEESAVFYVPENMQGTLLTDNTDSWKKTPDYLKENGLESKSALCTYVECECSHSSSLFGAGGTLLYRFCLGSDNVGNFDVERNCRYNLTLCLTRDGVNTIGNWKVTKESDWNDSRVLRFENAPYYVKATGAAGKIDVYYGFNSKRVLGKLNDGAGWRFIADPAALSAAGLAYSYNSDSDVISVSGSAGSSIGTSIPLIIKTFDDQISDESTITIIPGQELSPFWENAPEYIAQKGKLSVSGLSDGTSASFSLKDDGSDKIIRIIDNGDNTCTVSAINSGTAVITVTDSYGQTASVSLTILKPNLRFSQTRLNLNVEGDKTAYSATYYDNSGKTMSTGSSNAATRFDSSLYNELLSFKCALTENTGYFTLSQSEIYVSNIILGSSALVCDGNTVVTQIKADSESVSTTGISALLDVYVMNPFGTMAAGTFIGKMDDYTLLSAYSNLKTAFRQTSFSYDIDAIAASDANVSLEFSSGNNWSEQPNSLSHSYSNGVITVTGSSTGSHAAGKVIVRAAVKNKHCGEEVSADIGYIEVYLHSAIGGKIFDSTDNSFDIGADFIDSSKGMASFDSFENLALRYTAIKVSVQDGYSEPGGMGGTYDYTHINGGSGVGKAIYRMTASEEEVEGGFQPSDKEGYYSNGPAKFDIYPCAGFKRESNASSDNGYNIFHYEYAPNGSASIGTADADGRGYYVIHNLKDLEGSSYNGWVELK
ncbi:MAG: DUF4906 domain-containing protein [Bacteroidales bacterium]